MNSATIELRYFARVAELVGKRAESWPIEAPISGAQLLDALRQRYPGLEGAARLRLAINQEHAPASSPLAPGDEVAIFEPVTGG